ncbi:MAG TPA: class F sortase [Candidatus Saccharimonadales bacterium]|nr:class F sortase [Candidatus Saccharimonadales bacterium]
MAQPHTLLTKRWFLPGAIVLVAAAAASIIYLTQRSPAANTPVSKPNIITVSTDNPSETKPPKDGYAWRGRPAEPKYIQLPSIKVEGHVQHVGIDQHKAVAVPNNVHIAGWFVDSVQPGDTGLSIIDGHVDGRREAGIFKDLASMQKDDTFTVTLGNDSTRTFKVVKVSRVKTADAPSVLFSQEPEVARQLNLITCGGTFDRASKSYDERIIVAAALVP